MNSFDIGVGLIALATMVKNSKKISTPVYVFIGLISISVIIFQSTVKNRSHVKNFSEHAPCMAVTFDDLPGVGALHDGETHLEMNVRLLTVLQDRGIAATGFVNCARIEENDIILEVWLDAGMELGNHTSNHLDINTVDIGMWIEDVRACDERLRRSTSDLVRYFRYPMLHRGDTIEKRDAGYKALAECEFSIAPVSVDHSDYILSRAYSKAIVSNETAEQQKIAAAYIGHIMDAVTHYQSVALEMCSRDICHILLIHAHTLAADHVGELLDTLSGKGFRFISLGEALQDPVYWRKDVYVGKKGLSWLYRIEKNGEKRSIWDDEQAKKLEERFMRD